MSIEELMKRINFHPEEKREYTEKVEYSSKLTPYVDKKRSFFGYDCCKTNILAEKDDSVMMAMCKNRK